MDKKRQIALDRQRIAALGGPSVVAEILGIDGYNGARRVWNWTKRGVPAVVKLQYPKIFPILR